MLSFTNSDCISFATYFVILLSLSCCPCGLVDSTVPEDVFCMSSVTVCDSEEFDSLPSDMTVIELFIAVILDSVLNTLVVSTCSVRDTFC